MDRRAKRRDRSARRAGARGGGPRLELAHEPTGANSMNVNPRRIAPIAILLILGAVALGLWLKGRGANGPIEASGTVEATEVDLGFQVPGRLDSLGVDEG